MIHILWHNFRHWKVWAGGVILMGLLLIAAQCNLGPQPTATPIVTANPPEITGFTLIPPGPVPPGARIGIQVNVRLHGNRIDNYLWVVEEGEGSIVSGQGTPSVTYQAPETPGFYKVCVELEYGGGSVKDLTMVEVVEPTPTPTDTSTPTPTATPSPDTPTPTCTVTPTDTSTPTPTDTPSPDTPTPTPTATPTPTSTSTSTPTPTPTPTATPTTPPTPDAVVNVNAHLRSGPGKDYDHVRTLRKGDPLKVTGRNLAGDWLEVVCSDGKRGWVAASVLELNISLSGVPVIHFPPTPIPTHTPTPTSTATPLPAPTLLLPEDAGRFSEYYVLLTWEWIRPLGEDEYFSVRIRPAGDPEACWHPHTTATQYIGDPAGCESGKHYWSIVVARRDPASSTGWQEISRASEERWFDFFRPDEND